jgi:hypothetical protein
MTDVKDQMSGRRLLGNSLLKCVHPSIPQGERIWLLQVSSFPFVVRYRTMNGRGVFPVLCELSDRLTGDFTGQVPVGEFLDGPRIIRIKA